MSKYAGDMKECPHCGAQDGYYNLVRYEKSSAWFYGFKGQDEDKICNDEFHDGFVPIDGKLAYCTRCNKKIGYALREDE